MFQNNLLMAAASTAAGAYTVDDSVRYNDDDSPYLYRTPTTVGNRLTGTISLWYKRCNLGSIQQLYNSGSGNDIGFNASDKLIFLDTDSGASYITTQVFRDPSAWGHLVFAWDTTDTTAGDRIRIYHNGTEITDFDTETNPNINWGMGISNNVRQTVGANEGNTEEFDGYLSQFYYVDGQQLTPSSFGESDDNGVWRPIEFAGGGTGYSGSLVPVMTDYDAPSGEVTFSSEYSSYWKAWYAFNNSWDNSNAWIPTLNTMGWLAYEFDSAKIITRYIFGCAQFWDAAGARDFTFEGWDGDEWIVLDTQTGISWTSAGDERKLFTFSNTTSYIKYRLDITEDNGATNTGTNELMMIGSSSGYGENGFFLDFADSSDFGNDVSGNNNDYTSSGLAANDQVSDTPTSNHCILSTIDKSSNIPLSNGNLVGTFTSSWYNVQTTFSLPSSGKWSFQMKGSNILIYFGVIFGSDDYSDVDTSGTDALYYYGNGGIIATYRTGSYVQQTGLNKPTADENVECLIDMDNKEIGIVIDDTVEMGTDAGLEIQDTMIKIFIQGLNNTMTVDFGQGGYTPSQTGYKVLSTANLPTPTILDGTANFQTTLYTGDGSTRNIDQTENSTFQPDMVWIKNRSTTDPHMLIDATRGVTKELNPDTYTLETTDANGLTSFDADGFGLGTGAGGYNDNTESFVAWQWLAGGGAGSSNEDGTINTTTTTVNTTAGISVGTYTGTGSAATIGHGLGVAPVFVMCKERSGSGQWFVYHVGNTTVAAAENTYLVFNENQGSVDNATIWNDTAPTSTVFSIGTNSDINGSTNLYVSYAFADVEGFSKFSHYIGNGLADGACVHTGFKPAFIIIKKTTSANWVIYDSTRSPYNEIDDQLIVNSTTAETTGSEELDFLSNGFKIRTTDADVNTSGSTYVYMAFAEYPFGGEDVTPSTTF